MLVNLQRLFPKQLTPGMAPEGLLGMNKHDISNNYQMYKK